MPRTSRPPAGERAARQGRTLEFGIRLHVIVRETEAEARAAAARLVSRLDDATGAAIRLPLPENFWPQAAVVGVALAILLGIAGALTALGPIAGGYVIEWTWRAIFWINVPIGVAALSGCGDARTPALDVTTPAAPAGHTVARFTSAGLLLRAVPANWRVQPGQSPESAITMLIGELDRLKNEPISDRELQRTKNQFARDYILGRESDQQKALQLAHAVVIHRDIATADGEFATFQTITVADVQRVAANLIHDDAMAVTVVGKGAALQVEWK